MIVIDNTQATPGDFSLARGPSNPLLVHGETVLPPSAAAHALGPRTGPPTVPVGSTPDPAHGLRPLPVHGA